MSVVRLTIARALAASALFAACAALALDPATHPQEPALPGREIEVPDLNGKRVRPLADTNAVATVLVFISIDCPISNRYAPEFRRLEQRCREQHVSFWLVHPLVDESADAIRAHAREYELPSTIVRDDHHHLTRFAGATVTPEAVVVDRKGVIAYRGRIDDRYPALTRQRPEATRHDLIEAIEAVAAGRTPSIRRTQAVGCSIPEAD